MNTVVIDANIVIKLFWEEPDSAEAVALFNYLIEKDIKIIAPELLIHEAYQVLLSKNVDKNLLLQFFKTQIDTTIFISPLTFSITKKACDMVESGNAKSGYPSFFDSVYQALAQENDALFITADNAHLTKTKQFGNIALLKNWRQVVTL